MLFSFYHIPQIHIFYTAPDDRTGGALLHNHIKRLWNCMRHKISQSGSTEIWVWWIVSLAESTRHKNKTDPKTEKQSNGVWGLSVAADLTKNRDINFLLQINPPIHAPINLVHFPIKLSNLPNIAQKLPGRALTVPSLCSSWLKSWTLKFKNLFSRKFFCL